MVIYLWQKHSVDVFGFVEIPPGQYLVVDRSQICPHILKICQP